MIKTQMWMRPRRSTGFWYLPCISWGPLIVLLFLGLIGGIIYKIKNRVALPSGTGLVELGLPAGAQVREAILTGDKLTINTGTEVFIVEVSSRKVLLRVKASSP